MIPDEMHSTRQRTVRVLALVTDAYGGTGGIAQYNRDIVDSIAAHDSVASVVVVPRVVAREIDSLPPRTEHLARASKSKIAYVSTAMRIAERNAFDLVVCGHVNLLPIAYAVSRRSGAPLILLTYGAEVWEKKNPVIASLMRRVDAIVSISRHTVDRMNRWAKYPDARTYLLPNAIDLARYPRHHDDRSATLKRFGIEGTPVLLTLGRMDADEKAKGFDQIIEVLPSLIHDFPEIAYCAAGDGSDRARLMEKARELGVADHVTFTGYVPENDKPALFRASDVYVMPSRLEGFGFVFLEALASGLPVIGSVLDGGREALKEGEWGALVNPDDPALLSGAIRDMLTYPRVPPRSDLEYFSKPQFRNRTHEMLNRVLEIDATPLKR